MDTIFTLIIHLVSGAVGGNAIGSTMKNLDLGKLGNTIAGAIGGLGAGQILNMLLPAIAAAEGSGSDAGSLFFQFVGGCFGGGALIAIVGAVKNMMANK